MIFMFSFKSKYRDNTYYWAVGDIRQVSPLEITCNETRQTVQCYSQQKIDMDELLDQFNAYLAAQAEANYQHTVQLVGEDVAQEFCTPAITYRWQDDMTG